MSTSVRPHQENRKDLIDELINRYSLVENATWWGGLKLEIKRLSWKGVVRSTYLVKRVMDIVISVMAVLLFSPIFFLLPLLICLESPGPPFFKQIRVGRWGRTFNFWKFRSMYLDAEERKMAMAAENEMAGGVTFKMKHDPRITWIGRFIRRGSIDELPQLWNVLKGDMSLVGPRPPVLSEVEKYSIGDRNRLDVIPGITCIWQVSGRSNIPFPQQVELDVAYIESQSLWTDLKILLQTIPAVFSGRGAY